MLGNILLWFFIGILGGLIAFFVYPTKKEALPGMLVSGVVGAFFGGVLYSFLRIGYFATRIDPIASAVAILTAVVIIRLIVRISPEEEFLTEESKNNKLP